MPQVTLNIDGKLYQQAERGAREADFGSVEEYILFILKDVLLEENEVSSSFKEDEDGIKERLKSLGYIE